MAKPENPSEPFKRAVATAVRSLAGEPELEVNFSSEPPALKGLKARLPAPTRTLPAHEVAFVRGTGDAYALKKAYHDDKVHARFRPAGADADAIFEAAEICAGGSHRRAWRWKACARILRRNWNSGWSAKGFRRARSREEAPFADVVGLIVREKL